MNDKSFLMKASVFTALGILLSAQLLFAQYDNANLLAQSPDGKTVKLIWFIKKWSPEITGFDIKRKEGLKDWVKLNSAPILPEVSAKKMLLAVEADKTEENRIRAKLLDLLTSHDIMEMDNKEYLRKLYSDDKAGKEIALMIAQDYDLALMNGFAYVDHTVTKKENYQYGVFIQGTNVLLDSEVWNYGQIPDMNVVRDITSKSVAGKQGVQIMWDADLSKMKECDVAGFNIYREGIRLNTRPVTAMNSKDVTGYTWTDKSANSETPVMYGISAVSIFDIEGIISSYKYDPADHPKDYKRAVVTDITSRGYYFKEGVSVKWSFSKENEQFIKGFYIEKDNMPNGYKRVSGLLDRSVRAFMDTSASQVSDYIRFRVITVYNDLTATSGVERLYNYFPIKRPPAPQNLKASVVKGEKKYFIRLNWDPPISGDSATDYYRVYIADPASDKLRVMTESKSVRKNSFTYTIERGSTRACSICVSSLNSEGNESPLSDTVTVLIPSVELPAPVITRVIADSNKAVVRWDYPVIKDLKGFRIFQDKNEITTEKSLGRASREFVTGPLVPGASYEFSVRAIGEDGIVSEYSAPVSFIIPTTESR